MFKKYIKIFKKYSSAYKIWLNNAYLNHSHLHYKLIFYHYQLLQGELDQQGFVVRLLYQSYSVYA